MTIELAVEAGDASVSAPVESLAEAMVLSRMLIDAGATGIAVRETATPVASGEASCGGDAPEALQYVYRTEPPEESYAPGVDEVAAWVGSHLESEDYQAGDVGSDILSALTTADRWMDRNIFGSREGQAVLDALPYGELIQASHDTRIQAQYGEESARTRQRRESREAAERRQAEIERRRARRERAAGETAAAQTRAADAMIREAQGVTRAARRGEPAAMTRVRGIKTRAAQGEPEARRLWKIYTAVADDDQERIEAQLRG